jgi:excinuclease ABC subunit A
LDSFRAELVCAECGGTRLRPEARSVRVCGWTIFEITALTVRKARELFESLRFPDEEQPIAEPIVSEIAARLRFLDNVGLDYLTIDRPADTLSGGELQRVRLATGLGSGLVASATCSTSRRSGSTPATTTGSSKPSATSSRRGNTVVVVEHDEAIIRHADWLIDLGPGAGCHGGQIVAAGTPAQIEADPDSITGCYLAGRQEIPTPRKRRRLAKTRSITIEGVMTNNLKDVTVWFPLSGAGLRDGSQWLGQELAAERDLCPRNGPPTGRHRPQTGPPSGAPRRQPRRQGDSNRPVAHRPHPAEQPGHLFGCV